MLKNAFDGRKNEMLNELMLDVVAEKKLKKGRSDLVKADPKLIELSKILSGRKIEVNSVGKKSKESFMRRKYRYGTGRTE